MTKPTAPLYLERQTYRRRRIMDAARVLPVLGFILILLPVLWTQSGGLGTAGETVYLFVLWLWLIGVAALLSRPLKNAQHRELTQQRQNPQSTEFAASSLTQPETPEPPGTDAQTADPPNQDTGEDLGAAKALGQGDPDRGAQQ